MSNTAADAQAVAAKDELGIFLADQSRILNPYPLLAWLRENDRVAEIDGSRFLCRHEDVVAGYRDQRLSRRVGAQLEMDAHTDDGTKSDPLVEEGRRAFAAMLINQDEPGHRRLRRILEVAFKPSQVTGWMKRIDAITDELIESVAGKEEFDFRRELAFPLPERIICELMGVPYEDHALWSAWSETVVGATGDRNPSSETAADVLDAHRNFLLYFRDLVGKRRNDLKDDLVSLMIRAEADGERLTEIEMIGSLQMLIEAGHETTANLITNGMHTLLAHPDQYERLRADPSLVASAVEEMLRFSSPAHRSLLRVATTDIEIGGTTVREGSPVVMALNAANRDPTVFDDPERFDLMRAPNRHIAFAAGPHFCLGNQLARQEAQSMFRAVATRLPRLYLVREPKLKRSSVRSFDALIVTTKKR